MKENIKALLLEAYLLETAGAWDSMTEIIEFAERIYCELNNINLEEYQKRVEEIYEFVWTDIFKDGLRQQRKGQIVYEALLKQFLNI